MADVKKILETMSNGLKVNLFEFDIDNEESFNELKAYLINKVKISKVHNIEEYSLTYYAPKNLYCAPVRFTVWPDCRPPARHFPGLHYCKFWRSAV